MDESISNTNDAAMGHGFSSEMEGSSGGPVDGSSSGNGSGGEQENMMITRDYQKEEGELSDDTKSLKEDKVYYKGYSPLNYSYISQLIV